MKKYGVNELRKMFLEFFESKDHLALKSFSLVPHNDNSLLLVNSGMAPLKPYFTGQEIPPSKRVTTCQKCIRTGDIENIGKTARHGTFFEMLGNFSFGDYFKKESLQWSWEFLTEVVGLEPDRLYPSVYLDDDDAYEIWHTVLGIPEERIFRFGKEDNFWEHGAGPCGPCSEIYYDRGEKYGCGKPDCTVGCECDRYIEVWNNVFTQFEGDGNGNYTELEQKNIDTGMGLERLAVILQDADSLFTIDTNKALLDAVCKLANVSYQSDAKKDISLRIITDHVKSCTFMLSDGIMPSNEGRGYVLRRLLRRAARHGRLLGVQHKFLEDLSKIVIELSKEGYPELEDKQVMILKVLSEEEDKFNKTIDQGLNILAEMEERLGKEGKSLLSGEDAFKLYDTYGFPLDLTIEILEEKSITVDQDGFKAEMEKQRKKAQGAQKATNYMGADVTVYQSIDPAVTTEFVGYDRLTYDSEITVLTTDKELVQALTDGQMGTILVKQTPFYGTKGGQQADTGIITGEHGIFEVKDTIHLQGGKIGHLGVVKKGMFQVGEDVVLQVNETHRSSIAKNHSATHLLQKALRVVLGDHVEQAGSDVDEQRLRFDFTHFAAMSAAEIKKVEELVNREIKRALTVSVNEMTMDEAKQSGAMALFGEKYGELVRVVKMGEFSVELCGGTHVDNTSTISAFKIISESGIAAGVRRIEALTGDGLLSYYQSMENTVFEVAHSIKTTPAELKAKVETMAAELKVLQSENEKLKSKLANQSLGDVMDQVKDVSGIKVLATEVLDVDMNGLRNLGDQLKDKLVEGVIVIASAQDGKVNLIAMATDDAQKKGAHAGNLIKAISGCVGGGGGGRPNMAQAGGKNPAGIKDALNKVMEVVAEQIHSAG